MNKIKSALSRFMKDESGQGALEYILLLVVVLAVVFLFGDKLKGFVETKMGTVGEEIQGFDI